MKRLLYLFLILGIVSVSCGKDEEDDDTVVLNPTSKQNGFVVNYTAKWCGPCGDWGAPLIHDYNDAGTNVAAITCHVSGDPMYDAALYSSFTADRTTGGGVPSFWVGDTKTTSSGAMASLIGQGAAIAGVDYTYSTTSGVMTVTTKTKFFAAGTGDYYLSVLLLEDGIPGNSTAGEYAQSGTTSSYPNDDYKHDFVLRSSSVTGNAYGEKIVSNPTANQEIDKTYTFTIPAAWNHSVYPVAIIWKYDNSSVPNYKYINALKKKI